MPNSTAAHEARLSQAQLFLFGDLACTNYEQQLQRSLHTKSNPLLSTFFDRVNQKLRDFIASLSGEKQSLLPHFTSLIDLFSRRADATGASVLQFFFLGVHQVAQAIS